MVYSPKYCSATDAYTKTGLTSSEVDLTTNDYQLIQEAEAELEALTGRKFTSGNASTEYYSGQDKDILGATGEKATRIHVANWPVQSITALQQLYVDGSVATTYATLSSTLISAGTYYNADYWLETSYDPLQDAQALNGSILFSTVYVTPGRMNYKVSYTYGYATVPAIVKNLATCLVGIRMWVSFMGGQYNRLDSYNIPQQSVNKGSFYDRCVQNIAVLREEADRLLERIGRRPRTLFVASTGAR